MSERRVQRGAQFELITDRIPLPNGRSVLLDLLKHPGASAVVPFLDDGRVVLIRQYRFATGGYLLEVPAGKLDAGEAPDRCAARELEEETGYRAARVEKLGAMWPSPGFTDEMIHLFMASDLRPVAQRLEADEIIELVPMAFDEAIRRVHGGEIQDAKTAMALLLASERRRSGR